MSAEQRKEVAVVLGRPRIRLRYHLASDEIVLLLQLLDSSTTHILPRRRLPVHVRDNKDDPILAAALGGKASYLVTGDDDLLVLRDDPRIKSLQIVTVRDFLEVLSGSE